jgi:hypothetical protein
MSPLTLLRLKIIAVACVLGVVAAYLAFTRAGQVVLVAAIALAAALALWLWRARPELFAAAADRLGGRDQAGLPAGMEHQEQEQVVWPSR